MAFSLSHYCDQDVHKSTVLTSLFLLSYVVFAFGHCVCAVVLPVYNCNFKFQKHCIFYGVVVVVTTGPIEQHLSPGFIQLKTSACINTCSVRQ